MAQAPSGGNSSQASTTSSGRGGSSSSRKSSSTSSRSTKKDFVEKQAGKLPAMHADKMYSGKLDTKGKWANWADGRKAFEG